MCWERNLVFGISHWLQNLEINCDFLLLNIVISISKPMKKSLLYHTCTALYAKLLKLLEMGMSTLVRDIWTGSRGSQVLGPKSLEVSPCNLNHWEHGSWDLPLHTGPKSQVPSMTWMRTWQHLLKVRLEIGVESWLEEKATPNKSCKYFYIKSSRPSIIINHGRMVSWGSQVGTLPPCWDLLTWVGLGTWDFGPHVTLALSNFNKQFTQIPMLILGASENNIDNNFFLNSHKLRF